MEERLASLGLGDVHKLGGGYQSRGVYAARLDDQQVVVKLVDGRHVDRHGLETRVAMLARLGAAEATVCSPVALAGRLVNDVAVEGEGTVYAVAYEFAAGDAPDITDPEHACLMGRVLAELHAAMAALPRFDLPDLVAFPPVGALTDVAAELGVPLERLADTTRRDRYHPAQLLHGDFSGDNVRIHHGAVRVFDFDDSGYGPVEFDLALSLYMVLFGAMTGPASESYATFKANFLTGYLDHSGVAIAASTLDDLVTYRVVVLARWLAEPDTAPMGVRQSPESWRTTLRHFVHHYVETAL